MLNTLQKLTFIGNTNYIPDNYMAKNIFLCMHEKDRDVCIKTIAPQFTDLGDRIFVWFHKEDDISLKEENKEQYLEDLSKFDVFAVVITDDFLKGDDICFWELEQAKKKNMIILPLLFSNEREFVKQVNVLTQNRQALYPFDDDPTVIPFQDKLIGFMENVLEIDTKLVKNVHTVFSSSIFISYRKKDRKYIAPLMEAIHSREELDTVAIWYDESERAGEEFEQQIWDAFENANLGILLITKNTLEEGNYVAVKEYPFICEKKIPFIPIVVDDTDIHLTSEFLINEAKKNNFEVNPLPEALSLFDKEGIADKVLDMLMTQGVLPKSLSTEEKYYLAIAYQTHTLAPQNTPKALKYFSEAANEGYMEAYERIVRTYEMGIGIPKDDEKAMEVQLKYIRSLSECIDKGNKNYYTEYCYAVTHMIDLYKKDNYLDEMYACKDLVSFCHERCLQDPNSKWPYHFIVSKKKYAESLKRYKKWNEAKSLYENLEIEYQGLCDEFAQKQVAILGNSGITDPKDLYLPLTDIYRDLGECMAAVADTNEEKTEAVRKIQFALRIKSRIWQQNELWWAIETMYKEYLLLARLLLSYGMYQEAMNVLGEDYQVWTVLLKNGRIKREHLIASVKNLIYTGDAAQELQPGREMEYYKMAIDKINELKQQSIYDGVLENMINRRI